MDGWMLFIHAISTVLWFLPAEGCWFQVCKAETRLLTALDSDCSSVSKHKFIVSRSHTVNSAWSIRQLQHRGDPEASRARKVLEAEPSAAFLCTPASGSLPPKGQSWIQWTCCLRLQAKETKHSSCQRLETGSASGTGPSRTYWFQWLIWFHLQTPVYILLQYSHNTMQRNKNHVNVCSCWSHTLKQTSCFCSFKVHLVTTWPIHLLSSSAVHPSEEPPMSCFWGLVSCSRAICLLQGLGSNPNPTLWLGLSTYLTPVQLQTTAATGGDQSPVNSPGWKHAGELWFYLQGAAGPSDFHMATSGVSPRFW